MNASMAQFYIEKDLSELNTSYVDLMLLHHICATPAETVLVWKALEQMKHAGQAKEIGVSNFEVADLEMLLQHATECVAAPPAQPSPDAALAARLTPPPNPTRRPIAANQCHFAVGEMDYATLAFCNQHGIALESYGTLHGGVDLDDPAIATVAARHNVSNAVVMLRYVTQRNISVVTASDSLAYDDDDVGMFSATLSLGEMQQLDAVQQGKTRTCSDCYKDSCRSCQAALKAAGCKPFGGQQCRQCAEANAAKVMGVCQTEPMMPSTKRAPSTKSSRSPEVWGAIQN